MVNKGQQLRMRRNVERLFTASCGKPVAQLEKELGNLGFTQTGGDLLALQFENRTFELFLEILLDDKRCVHRYRIVPFEKRAVPQQKFRW